MASSAKSKILEKETDEVRSFTKIRNNSGPRILPCGTPEMTGRVYRRNRLANRHTLDSISEIGSKP